MPSPIVTWKRRPDLAFRAASFQVGDELPTEFLIFPAGKSDSTKGVAVFDDTAARSVMAEYEKQGVDVQIDLEHHSLLSPDVRHYDPDARGWCKLEVRDGALWAVAVRWTPDGAERLREKRQRYISPAFRVNEHDRVLELVNIAICARPATYDAEPLVAANRSEQQMDPKLVQEALDALVAEDDAKCAEILKSMLAAAAGGGAPPADPAVEDETLTEPPAGEPPTPTEEEQAMTVAASRLVTLTGKSEISEALEEVEVWRTAYLEREADRANVAQQKATLESQERRKLVGELVKLGAETPATAWCDDKGAKPCKRLTDEPIAELRERVKKLSAARGKAPTTPAIKPPPGEASGAVRSLTIQGHVVQLSQSEVDSCNARAGDDETRRTEVLTKYAEIKLRQGRTAPVTLER